MARPGRMRFEYDPPSPILLIADRFYVYYVDKQLAEMSKVGLKSTPAWFLLRDPISFDDLIVTRFERGANGLAVTVVEPAEPDNGSLTMVFGSDPLALRQWTIVDQQRKTTTVSISDAQFGVALDPELFVYQDPFASWPPPIPALSSSPMPVCHMPLVGIPACLRTVKERCFHGVNEKYPNAVIDAARCLPVLIPAVGSKVDVRALLDRLDGLLLTGSPSNVHPSHYGAEPSHPEILHDPERDATTLPLIREAVRRDLPILAICRGIQELNVALGGTLHQRVHEIPGRLNHRSPKDSPDGPYGPAHSVALTTGGLLASLTGSRGGDGQFATLPRHRSSCPQASRRSRGPGWADRGGESTRSAVSSLACNGIPSTRRWRTHSRAPCFRLLPRPAVQPTRASCRLSARHERIKVGSRALHAFFPFRACRNALLFSPGPTPSSIIRKRREQQTLFRTDPSPLWVRFPPNASDMQAPGLPPRPGADVLD